MADAEAEDLLWRLGHSPRAMDEEFENFEPGEVRKLRERVADLERYERAVRSLANTLPLPVLEQSGLTADEIGTFLEMGARRDEKRTAAER